jgi:hypothetical protein
LGHRCTVSFQSAREFEEQLDACTSSATTVTNAMSDASNVARNLRERLNPNTDERLGRALSDLLENPLLTGALGRAFDAREKAVAAQELAMGALNLPSAADIERLTRRLRSLSHRLEGIEDGVDRLDRSLTPTGVEARLVAVEAELKRLSDAVERLGRAGGAAGRGKPAGRAKTAGRAKPAGGTKRAGGTRPASRASKGSGAKGA